MFRSLSVLVLCRLFVSVYSVDGATDCIFDWQSYGNEGNGPQIVVDFSGERISTLEEGDTTYHYISGQKTTRSEVGDEYQVFYFIQQVDVYDGFYSTGVVSACDFLGNIYANYLLPIPGNHSDFPPAESICPMKEGTTNIFKVQSSEQLKAPSKLPNGEFVLELGFIHDYINVGGISGIFKVLRN